MTHLTFATFAQALLWAALAALAAWLVLTPVRRRSLAGLLTSLVVTGAAASAGCLWGAVHAMLLPGYDWRAITAITAFSLAVSGIAAVAVMRRLVRDSEALRADVYDVGTGQVPADGGRPLVAEIQAVRAELRRSATTLAQAREREQALETSRRELVAWVSHDLRAPLAGLRAMAEALEDGVPEDPETYYKRIGESVDRLDRMVQDLFDLSRIQAGAVNRHAEPLSLGDLTSDTVAALHPLAAAQGVRLAAHPDGDPTAGTTVDGDTLELGRALANLVSNALRHTPRDGTVHVTVATAPGSVDVLVADECGGISEEHLSRLFDVGFRAEPARTTRGPNPPGGGLGLAIARGIVEAHGGTLTVANTGPGCVFRLHVPARTGGASG